MILEIDGREVAVTHPERVIWPASGTTKRDLIDYLLACAPLLLRHLRDRPTMLWRFPEGIDGPGWFQAQCRSRPDWVPTHAIIGRTGKALDYCVIEEPATLVWLANLGTIELHPHGWTIDRPDVPLGVVFDLDPGPPAGLVEAAVVALAVAERLRAVRLEPVVKTSGRLGLHVAAAAMRDATFDTVRAFARSVAADLSRAMPALVLDRSDRAERAGRVYIDWVQNNRNRQLVAPYSPRATAVPAVSTPLTWDEVREIAAGGRQPLSSFADVIGRIERYGDLWQPQAPRAGRAGEPAAAASRAD
ncbi:MAG: bifunctional non-ous end joining protein LigD [Chloroflexota bacterium]|nr:bifunctional non-ous end joining protein LigD [Chloroflexota bacterium]